MDPRFLAYDAFVIAAEVRFGGMSRVLRATLRTTSEVCALKFASNSDQDADSARSFQREVSALGDMEHENIVRMLGIGTDGTERFIVLEWLEESLVDRLLALGPMNWEFFYETIGRPLLEGIQYAHGRKFVHRDLKPLNIMFNRIGIPKITDFGISRALEAVRIGGTFMQAGSHPWTPAESDDGIFSERRDLYSWAAICIACLSGRLDYQLANELREQIDRLRDTAPSAVLRSCLAEVPSARPANATALLWDLDDFHAIKLDKIQLERVIGTDLTPNVHKSLEDLIPDLHDPLQRMLRVFGDFTESCYVSINGDDDLEFFGKTFTIRTGRASGTSPWLVIKEVRPAVTLNAQMPVFKTTIRLVERIGNGADPTVSRTNIIFLESYLRTRKERGNEEDKKRDEERYLAMLQDILASRMRALRHLPAISYTDGKWEGGEFVVIINGIEVPATDEQRIIRAGGIVLVFEVVRVSQGRCFLRSVGPRRGQPPPDGDLQVDTLAQRRALERQEEAVKTIRADLAVSPALKRIILKPGTASVPDLGGRPASADLSPDKAVVLDAALGLRQLMVVQGPPGTGKTKLITEIVKRYLHENPHARILIAAQTHIAIDHVIEKLLELDDMTGRIVRIARTGEEKVSVNVRIALLQNCLKRWCQTTAEASREFMRGRGKILGLDSADVELSIRLEALLSACVRVRELNESLSVEQNQLSLSSLENGVLPSGDVSNVESATIALMTMEELNAERIRLIEHVQRLRDEMHALGPNVSQLAELGESDLRDWTSAFRSNDPAWLNFRRELELQVAWLDLLGQLKQFEEIVLKSASVVAGTCVGLGSSDAFTKTNFDLCIIDEASKATATEALIPMVRSERCLVVGDPRQLPPFERGTLDLEGYVEGEVKETLLDYLLPKLPKECVFELTHQHRMCKSIGELISHVFYQKKLINDRSDTKRASWISRRFQKPVIWMDTKGAPQTQQGHSFVNRVEQDRILSLLARLQRGGSRAHLQTSVAVIAAYAAQARALDLRIQYGSLTALAIDVATVDSFQGRESDICILSVTLSNAKDYLGFLTSIERLNVALSRAKDLLVIVGDMNFCYDVPGKNPFRSVIDYIEANPLTCEKIDAGK